MHNIILVLNLWLLVVVIIIIIWDRPDIFVHSFVVRKSLIPLSSCFRKFALTFQKHFFRKKRNALAQ